jgi:hypothetical protein
MTQVPYEQQDPKEDPSTKKLLEELRKRKAPDVMIKRAEAGAYHDFRSPYATPQVTLWQDAGMFNLGADFLQMILEGEFDADTTESENWFQNSKEAKSFTDNIRGFDERSDGQ